ncbi:nicotinamide riboside transporter PnuC [Aquimarina sp. ERC-38]|uniref:nicotinamide riboside transporter PnuC n=1 Tax=Aquimarina sp. ERC-38 TaxID=2949996 RepID=UPI0022462B51|nr:nicotinamide riboside transporter PnuC [Aquimarina sp. ERC-38]UZO81602.1 nicotinamide riboside transporter PnuC [Aquimarina sp. ERC-38]
MNLIFDFFLEAYSKASLPQILLEAITFVFGIISVLYAKKENIWVYPTGLIATIISVYLLYTAGYYGDMMMNFYYSAMSIFGWYNWSRVSRGSRVVLISRTTGKEKALGILLCILTMIVTYTIYQFFGTEILIENYIDILTSGMFFTAMWYMATKKIENWTLWIIADLITVPLYAYRGLGMLSLQYLIFTFLAIQGYRQWNQKIKMTSPKIA